ncbi:hypothetical protein [Pseudoduganella armeniaca]|uniref:Uncharacterized protein n=1 Tax=Pseudoduganella armeniaca TaxID=2072590 RepID=A0A2R4CD70_9BURK|nr:hypothetical protein [Pseudoduganella armeniaca]AVR97591.1 hypothetical protein C9I28_19575 [Pseudoduganella armeniaca]
MTSISPFGSRPYTATPTTTGQPGTRTDKAAAPIRQEPGSGVPRSDVTRSDVALSSSALDLQDRVAGLGNATVDLAQNLLGKFAQHLFGDAMQGATIDFDAVSLDSQSTMEAGALHAGGANGVMDAAAFRLTDSAHFLGKGTITLADGQKFDFEVEVRYESSLSAGTESARRRELAEQNPAMPLPAVEFPDIDWPGSLNDIFKLMDKRLSADINAADGDKLGTLSARLLKLVNSAQALDTYGPPTTTQVKQATSAYATELASAPAPVKAGPTPVQAPAPAPVVDTQTVPPRGGDIPLTISTTPPPDDAA